MNHLRRTLPRPAGALLVLAALLCFAGVHLFHFHTETGYGPVHLEVPATPGHGHAGVHDAAQAVCPVCSLLAHSALDQGRGPARLDQPQATGLLAPVLARSLLARDVIPLREPRAPPFLAG